MKYRLFTGLLLVLSGFAASTGAALSADWNIRPGDTVLSEPMLNERLSNSEITFFDGGKSVYGPDDAYAYVYAGGEPIPGTYHIANDGVVCVDFKNGWSRCDLYVINGEKLYLITEEGDRFPVKE